MTDEKRQFGDTLRARLFADKQFSLALHAVSQPDGAASCFGDMTGS